MDARNTTTMGRVWLTRSLTKKKVYTNPCVVQSALSLRSPWKAVFQNYRLANEHFAHTWPPVRNFLMLGAGGGTCFHVLHHYWPEAELIGVEKDPEVIRIAEEYFGLPPQTRVIEGDVRDVLQGELKDYQFDAIFVDVFKKMYSPSWLYTTEFLRELADHLTPGGILVFNLVRRHCWDKQYRAFKADVEKHFCCKPSEEITLSGRLLPVVPHNVILATRMETNGQ